MSSHTNGSTAAVTSADLLKRKKDGTKFSVITCYDAAFARLIEQSSIDMVLVGDSMGNVILGHKNTIPVTIEDILHHTSAVSRVLRRPFLVADMPFLSYHLSTEQALCNAGKLIQQGGAQSVKLEGGKEVCDKVAALTAAGIPVVGHLGLTPQSVHVLGGYKIQGRGVEARAKLKEDAMALQDAGAMAVVLELVPASLAAEITASLVIPTIGIGAGVGCDAQVLVLHDMLGFDAHFNPKFLKKYANLGQIISEALTGFDTEVKSSTYPGTEHSFSD